MLLSLILLGFGPTVLAQEDTIERRYKFHIPQQAADAALTDFAEQADLTLIYPAELVREKTANALIGTYARQEAIDILLAGTGLTGEFTSKGVLSILIDDMSAEKGEDVKVSKTKKVGLGALFAALFGIGANAQEPANDASVDELIEEVVVFGTRRSIESALETKRNSRQMVDSLSADGISRLPELNLGESIGRIAGMQIDRSAVSRGGSVTFRGLGGEFQGRSINGYYLATPDGSNLNLGRLRSEVFSGIDVLKSQTASNMTGGLVGIIDLKTGGALQAGNRLSINVDSYDEGLADKNSLGAALQFSRQLIDDKLAFRAAYGYKENDFREDSIIVNTYSVLEGRDTPDDATDDLYAPELLRLLIRGFEGDTHAASFGLEYQPDDNWHAELTGFYTSDDSVDLFQQRWVRSRDPDSTLTPLDTPVNSGQFGRTHQVIRIDNPMTNMNARGVFQTYDIQAYTGSLEWEDDNWVVGGALHHTTAERTDIGWGANFVTFAEPVGNGLVANIDIGSGGTGPQNFHWDVTPHQVPTDFTLPYAPSGNRNFLDQVDGIYRYGIGYGAIDPEKDEETSLHLDVTRHLEAGPLQSISFGAVYRDKSTSQRAGSVRPTGMQLDNLDNSMFVPSPASRAAFFGGDMGSFDPSQFWSFDVFRALRELTPATLDPGDENYYISDIGAPVLTNDSSGIANTFDADIKIAGAYAELDFAHEFSSDFTLHGNLGVRYEDTERETLVAASPGQPIVFEYDNTLPSLNLIGEIKDDFVVRFYYGETLRRPEPDSFAVLRTLQVGSGGNAVAIDLGASDLRPFLSENLGLSFEWYNREGSAITLALYNMDVTDFAAPHRRCPPDGGDFGIGPLEIVADSCLTTVATPAGGELNEPVNVGAVVDISEIANQDKFSLSGFEIMLQQNLDFLPAPWNGFGGQINYTKVDLDSDGPFAGVSEDTYNAVAYYESERFGARLAYNHRSDYIAGGGGTFSGASRVTEARGQLDFGARFNVTDQLSLSFEAFNIGDEELFEYQGHPTRPRNYFTFGRTFSFGAKYTFE